MTNNEIITLSIIVFKSLFSYFHVCLFIFQLKIFSLVAEETTRVVFSPSNFRNFQQKKITNTNKSYLKLANIFENFFLKV